LKHQKFLISEYFNAAEQFLRIHNISHEKNSIFHVSEILRYFSLLPYENISKILRLNSDFNNSPFRMPGEIIEDFNKYNLGGTCFSLTLYLKTILEYFNYQNYIVMADMNSGKNTHCALILVFNNQQYLLDPGYLLQEPLLISDKPEKLITPTNSILLDYDLETERHSLSTIKNGNVVWRYSFQNRATEMETFFMHWENSFHWMTMHGICMSKKNQEGFIYLHNNYLKKEGSGITHKGKFKEEISVIAEQYFNIPDQIIRNAQKALLENLHYDKELGYKVPKWIK